jgi:hypothetical protein
MEIPLETHNRIFQDREHEQLFRLERLRSFEGVLILVGGQLVRLKEHGKSTFRIFDREIAHAP